MPRSCIRKWLHLLVAAAAIAAAASESSGSSPNGNSVASCPPSQLVGLKTFNLASYIVAPWYIQKQIPLDYQPLNESYCVRAEYQPLDPKNITAGLIVNNYANLGAVNGPTRGTSKYETNALASRLVGFPVTFKAKGRDGKLMVGPEILTKILPGDAWRAIFGPYWVVAVGYSQNTTLRYEWAIVLGGPPEIASPSGNGCSTVPYRNASDVPSRPREWWLGPATQAPGSTAPGRTFPGAASGGALPSGPGSGTGGGYPGQQLGGAGGAGFGAPPPFEKGGLWFLTRKPVDPWNTAKMEVRAEALGLDTSQMVNVPQTGCLYQAR